jgi:hypothetical protein
MVMQWEYILGYKSWRGEDTLAKIVGYRMNTVSTFYKWKAANTFSLGCSSRFAGSNKITRAHYTTQALPDS